MPAANSPKKKKTPTNATPTEAMGAIEGFLPPQAPEIERYVLGALMIVKDAFSDVAQLLTSESFYVKSHELVYEAISTLGLQQKPIDMLSVTEELRRNGNLEAVGGAAFIAELTRGVPGSANLEYHAHIVANKALSRQLITFASTVLTEAYQDSEDVDTQLQAAEAALFDLAQFKIKKDLVQVGELKPTAIEEIEEAASKQDGISGLPSGFDSIDEVTSGWQRGELIVIGARPAMGKTAFALSVAKNIAVDRGIPVAVFSLEMTDVSLVKRLMSNVCEIEMGKILKGDLEPYEWQQLASRASQLDECPLYFDDTPGLSIFELRSKARRMVREKGIELIIIDYLQLMTAVDGMRSGSNREQEISLISRSLKTLAKELNIPIIALAQLNRNVEIRQGDANSKQPQLSDLRESGAIEQDADIVCFLHRPEYYKIKTFPDDNTSTQGVAVFIIAKHRNGPTAEIRMAFRGSYTKFAELDSGRMISIPSSLGNPLPPPAGDPYLSGDLQPF